MARKSKVPTISELFGDRVQQVRPVSQGQLAEALGISRVTMTMIENGQRKVSLEEALRIAALMGVSPTFLITPRDPEAKVKLGDDEYTARQIWDWIRGLYPLSERDEEPFFAEMPAEERIYEAYGRFRGHKQLIFEFRPEVEPTSRRSRKKVTPKKTTTKMKGAKR